MSNRTFLQYFNISVQTVTQHSDQYVRQTTYITSQNAQENGATTQLKNGNIRNVKISTGRQQADPEPYVRRNLVPTIKLSGSLMP